MVTFKKLTEEELLELEEPPAWLVVRVWDDVPENGRVYVDSMVDEAGGEIRCCVAVPATGRNNGLFHQCCFAAGDWGICSIHEKEAKRRAERAERGDPPSVAAEIERLVSILIIKGTCPEPKVERDRPEVDMVWTRLVELKQSRAAY